jgi:hypothetical protein
MFNRKLAFGLAAGAVVALTATTVPSAFAGTPTPEPSVSTNFGTPPPKPVIRVRDWEFDVQQSDIGGLAVNDVEGRGAIPMSRWTDDQSSNNVDTFRLGGRFVTLWHDGLDQAAMDVNTYTCTVTFDQPNGRFRILRTGGLGAQLRSVNGQFDLQGELSFPLVSKHVRHGDDSDVSVCPLSFLSRGQILRIILFGGRQLPEPVFSDFAVQGRAGVFALPTRPVPHPTPTKTDTYAPTAPASA